MGNKGNSFANGNSMNNGSSSACGSALPRLVKSQQDAGFAIRQATIWDDLEPGIVF